MHRILSAVCRAVPDCHPLLDRWFAVAGWIAVAGLVLVLLEWIIPRGAGRWIRVLGQCLLVVGVAGTFATPPAPQPISADAQTSDAMQKIAITHLMAENLELQATLEREKDRRQGRALLKDQFEALQALKGKLAAATVIAPTTPEAIDFANDIILALIAAGVDVRMRPSPPGFPLSGTTIWSAKADDPVIDAFTKARLAPAWKSLATLSVPALPHDIPLIAIGNRPLDAPAAK